MVDRGLSSVYVSYRWEGASQALVERLRSACAARGIELITDTETVRYKESIGQFMRELGRGRCVIVILGDGYLKSEKLHVRVPGDRAEQGFSRSRLPHRPAGGRDP